MRRISTDITKKTSEIICLADLKLVSIFKYDFSIIQLFLFRTKNTSSFPVRRLRHFLVKQEVLQETLIRYIFTKKRRQCEVRAVSTSLYSFYVKALILLYNWLKIKKINPTNSLIYFFDFHFLDAWIDVRNSSLPTLRSVASVCREQYLVNSLYHFKRLRHFNCEVKNNHQFSIFYSFLFLFLWFCYEGSMQPKCLILSW